eukprot:GFKZ01012151.1.p1 GENE.GFKZ01012151.1~~GFKZ01012151.1.p1  ORF type:complete len:222 (+),score=39.91 GFKZ01012151.1:296-961(+)
MDMGDFKRISSLPPPTPTHKPKQKSAYSTLRRSLTFNKKKSPTMASSSRKQPSRSGALGYFTATFYRRGPDSATKEALSVLRKAESALRRVIELDGAQDPQHQKIVLGKAIDAVQILKGRLSRCAEMAERVAEWDGRMRERMDELEADLEEAKIRTLQFEYEGEDVRSEICRIRREIEKMKQLESGEESGSEECDKPKDRICVRTLASGDWDDTLDEEVEF